MNDILEQLEIIRYKLYNAISELNVVADTLNQKVKQQNYICFEERDEELAAILRAMAATGIGTSSEQKYLREAADRLEEEKNNKWQKVFLDGMNHCLDIIKEGEIKK